MTNKFLGLIAPYFGKLPPHFQLWLNSCACNPDVTWFLFTDDRTPWDYPENVKVTYCTLSELRDRFQQSFDFPISLDSIKKLGDYKPFYGYLFKEELSGYRAWGHIDVGDVIYGDFDKFSLASRIEQFDRLGYVGHLTIYRNTRDINERFRAEAHSGFNYRDVLSSPDFMNFEEIAKESIGQIWQDNSWITGSLDDCVADLSVLSYPFKIQCSYESGSSYQNNDHLIFEWNNGHLFGHEIAPNGGILTREFLYVHFKRRPMRLFDDVNSERYLIAPDGFHPLRGTINTQYLKRLSRTRFPDPVWLANKKRNLRERIQRLRKN